MNDTCCHQTWTKQIDNNLKAIMKVMRIAIGRGKSGLNVKELVDMSKPYLEYSLINYKEFDTDCC